MGIQGLITFVKEATENIQLEKIRGSRVAIDSYCWLHKGAFGCASKLAIGEKTDQYVRYCMNLIEMLTYHGITPIMVFDGRHLSAKRDEETSRREERKKKKEMAAKLLRSGQKDKAWRYLAASIDVTHLMALELIRACRAKNIDCIVAPYEADAQLAYLNINNYVDYVITEDSDLILFGCRKVLFKLQKTGTALLYDSEKLPEVMKLSDKVYDFSLFRRMCILSGCDYLPSLPGIGLVKAKKFIVRVRDLDIRESLVSIPVHLNMPKIEVTSEYIENFLKAEATFLYQYVYDPKKRKIVRLTEPPSDIEEDLLKLSGEYINETEAFQHALGNIDPFSKKQLDNWNPDNEKLLQSSIWNLNPDIRQLKDEKPKNVNPGFSVTTRSSIKRTVIIEESEAFEGDYLDEYRKNESHIEKRQKIEEVISKTVTSSNCYVKLFPIKSKTVVAEEAKVPCSIEDLKSEKDEELSNEHESPVKSPVLNTRPRRKIIQSKFLSSRTKSENSNSSTSISSFFKKSLSVTTFSTPVDETESPPSSQNSEIENETPPSSIKMELENNEGVVEIPCLESLKKFEKSPLKMTILQSQNSPPKKVSPIKKSPQILVPARRQGLSRIQKLNKPADNSSQKLLSQFGFTKKPLLGP
ncbi:exonuclease 1 [Chrysoperla carnea]|uniref:exonuclease 1 n=1 Tax=Chrysoperla carnea TaxID=189513 RepID=UPI001D05DB98|nr:exonuclease 1 [Chrysoperla carnea]